MDGVIKNPEDLYETRNQIISVLEGVDPEAEQSNFDWLHRPKKRIRRFDEKMKI